MLLLYFAFLLGPAFAELPPSCDSEIYCWGELLEDVQLSRIYPDSKTFVDKRLLFRGDEVLRRYRALKEDHGGKVPPPDVLRAFVESCFQDGDELDEWTPGDWREDPSILLKIRDKELRGWAKALNGIWRNLSRKVDKKVKEDPELYSLIYVPNGFVIPGGRFKELYYWDTFWIVNGLLICDMIETAKGVIENLLYLLKEIGHIPNGSRVYYLERTQPPMVTQMVYSYYKRTGDLTFVKENIELLDHEMDYFIKTRTIDVTKDGKKYKLFRYFAPSSGPRPESYREDVETAQSAGSEDGRQELYIYLKSGAESGWDFSTRWFISNATNRGNISDIRTPYIVPVDLNALLYKDFQVLAEFHAALGNTNMAARYTALAKDLLAGISEFLWSEEEGIWLDYDLMNGVPRKYFYMSNFVPLWTKAYSYSPKEITKRVMQYINKENLTQYIGGTPTSLEYSGEQWDFPNVWPPLQAFFIQGMDRIGTKEASEVAFNFANIYIASNYKGYHDNGVMYEKYDALSSGRTGGGGEYEAQSGFGWTNGVALELLERWGSDLGAQSNLLEQTGHLAELTSRYS